MHEQGHRISRLPTRFASSSVAASESSSSGGLFSWLIGDKSKSLPPLELPLPGVELPPTLPDYVEPGKTKITTLPNGLKIASETSPVCMQISLLFYILLFCTYRDIY